MSDIFREVDEALHQEKVARFWRQHGPALLAAAGVMILATAATTGWRAWDAHRDGEETARLVKALESKDPATELQTVLNDTRAGHEAVGLMNAAGVLAGKKEYAKAAELYAQVYESAMAPGALKDVARLLYVRAVLMTDGEKDGQTLAAVLKPVATSPMSAFVWNARLDLAMIQANLLNDYASALGQLEKFEDQKDLAPTLMEKAMALKQVYSLEASSKKGADKDAL